MACFSWKCPPDKTKLPDSNRLILPGFHNADRLNDTCFQCIYSFNTLFGLLLQFHPAPVRRAGLQILTVFLLPRHRNCLHFTLTLINVAINKNKCCQEKSGRNQFSLDAHLTLPTLKTPTFPPFWQADGFCSSAAAHPSTVSDSGLTKTFLKIVHFSSSARHDTLSHLGWLQSHTSVKCNKQQV